MALTSPALALTAAVFIALQAVSVERGLEWSRDAGHEAPTFVAALLTIVVSSALFWVLLAVEGDPLRGYSRLGVALFVLSGVLNPAAFRLLYFRGIDEVGASVSAAIVAGNPAVAALLAVPLLGERVSLTMAAGLACLVGGGVVIQFVKNSGTTKPEVDLVTRKLTRAGARGLLYPLVAMVLVAVSYLLVDLGLSHYPNPLTGTAIAQTTALGLFSLLVVYDRERIRELPITADTRWIVGSFVVAGVFAGIGWLANFYALGAGTAVVVIGLYNTFPLFVLVISYALAREYPRSRRVLAAIALIVVGAVLVRVG